MGIERESNGFAAMRLSPADPTALFFGKMAAVFLLISVMEIAGFAALAVLYRAPVWENLGPLALVAIEVGSSQWEQASFILNRLCLEEWRPFAHLYQGGSWPN